MSPFLSPFSVLSQVESGTINPFASDFDGYTPTSSTCFVAGTPVWTDKGLYPIETIEVGSKVWAYNALNNSWELETVSAIHQHKYEGEVVGIEAGDSIIRVTPNHPVMVESGYNLRNRPRPLELPSSESEVLKDGHRWVSAGNLVIHDQLMTYEEDPAIVQDMTVQYMKITVYNITVDSAHTYAVGAARIVVHNKKIR